MSIDLRFSLVFANEFSVFRAVVVERVGREIFVFFFWGGGVF